MLLLVHDAKQFCSFYVSFLASLASRWQQCDLNARCATVYAFNPFYNIAWLAREEARPNCKTGYYTYYQSLLPLARASIGALAMPSGTRTVNLYETHNLPIPHRHPLQKHAVRFKRSTSVVCPLPECHHMDSALQILSGCQYPAIRYMVTERHNIASRMILKV
eukprot:1141594-Pelagomonas_calceolata.AAC.1